MGGNDGDGRYWRRRFRCALSGDLVARGQRFELLLFAVDNDGRTHLWGGYALLLDWSGKAPFIGLHRWRAAIE